MIIRRAGEADLPAILVLYQELSGAYDGVQTIDAAQCERAWQRISNDPRQYLLVADIEGEVKGTLNLTVIPNLGHGGQPWGAVDNVVVATDQRGQGIGAALIEEAGNIARKERCYKIVLSSNIARKKAHDFYRRMGWKETHVGFSLEL